MTADAEMFVIASSNRVHRQSCHHVELFTRGFESWEHRYNGDRETVVHPIGWEPPAPVGEYDYWVIVGKHEHVTADDLVDRRYIRCRVCAPDVPKYQRKDLHVQVRVQGLRSHHIGLPIKNLGRLSKVSFDEDGYELVLDGRPRRFAAADVVVYVKPDRRG